MGTRKTGLAHIEDLVNMIIPETDERFEEVRKTLKHRLSLVTIYYRDFLVIEGCKFYSTKKEVDYESN